VDHDEAARRIDEDRLATYAPEHEHPPLRALIKQTA
jgi:hypothetical protein